MTDKIEYVVVMKDTKNQTKEMSPVLSYNTALYSKFCLWLTLNKKKELYIQRVTDKKIIIPKRSEYKTRC